MKPVTTPLLDPQAVYRQSKDARPNDKYSFLINLKAAGLPYSFRCQKDGYFHFEHNYVEKVVWNQSSVLSPQSSVIRTEQSRQFGRLETDD
jgi:hypothetical protein